MSATDDQPSWPREHFKEVFEALRAAAGFPDPTSVARAAGVHPSTISNWFNARLDQQPTIPKLSAVARALGVEGSVLWEAAGILPNGATSRIHDRLGLSDDATVEIVPGEIGRLTALFNQLDDGGKQRMRQQLRIAIEWAEGVLSRSSSQE